MMVNKMNEWVSGRNQAPLLIKKKWRFEPRLPSPPSVVLASKALGDFQI
jgi:hypothetical protein